MGDYWDVTIAQLQPLIARPTLKPALLQKPPFRFLHDIVTALMAATGFPQGLFPPSELETEFVKAMDKEQKLAFLNRLIAAVQLAVGREIDVAAGKIIAGAEPEKTNALLQALAEAGHNAPNIDMTSIIAGVDAGQKPGAAQPQRAAVPPAAAAPAPVAAAAPTPAAAAAAPASKPRSAAAAPSGALRPTRAPIELPPAEAGEDFVATTTRLIGALIAKPKMTEKLLRKPPFRFLHDVLTGVLAATQYPDEYFTPAELDSGSFTETNAKLAFLQKWIDLVAATNDVDLSQVNPKKIAAGLEPEQTNTLLQQFAYAAASGIAAKDVAAKMAASGGATTAAAAPTRDTRAEEAAAAAAAAQVQAEAQAAAERKAKAAADAEARKNAALAASQAAQAEAASSKPMPKLGLSGLDAASEEAKEEDAAVRTKIERPKTARKAPPKLASNLIEEKKPNAAAATNAPDDEKKAEAGGVKLIAEGENQADDPDDEDNGEDEKVDLMGGDALAGFDAHDGADGMVVRAMKDKLKGVQQQESGGMKIRSAASTSAAAGGLSQSQLDELRRQIQLLCQSVNPLGKCLEYVREDMDAMNKELVRWRQAYTTYTEELDQERKTTERIVEPLQKDLQDVEAQIAEQQRKIHALKGTILRNDATIQQLLEAKTAV